MKKACSPCMTGASSYFFNSIAGTSRGRATALDGLGGPVGCQMGTQDFFDPELEQA